MSCKDEVAWVAKARKAFSEYGGYVKSGEADQIEFGFGRFNGYDGYIFGRICKSPDRPTEYRVRFKIQMLSYAEFETRGDDMIMVDCSPWFFADTQGLDFDDYISRCRVRLIRTLRRSKKPTSKPIRTATVIPFPLSA